LRSQGGPGWVNPILAFIAHRSQATLAEGPGRAGSIMGSINASVDLQHDGEIAVVTVDNPPVNALKHEVRAGLAEALRQVRDDGAVKAVVISYAVFCLKKKKACCGERVLSATGVGAAAEALCSSSADVRRVVRGR